MGKSIGNYIVASSQAQGCHVFEAQFCRTYKPCKCCQEPGLHVGSWRIAEANKYWTCLCAHTQTYTQTHTWCRYTEITQTSILMIVCYHTFFPLVSHMLMHWDHALYHTRVGRRRKVMIEELLRLYVSSSRNIRMQKTARTKAEVMKELL